jgi:Zn-dependent M28 family amino/carboxypeptidase
VGAALTGGEPVTWQFTTGGRAAAGVDGERLRAHVQALAHDSMAGRGSATTDELRAAGYVRAEFTRYGLEPYGSSGFFQPFAAQNLGSSQNVVGRLRGAGTLQDEWVIVGAHYDHVGVRNGQVYNGADDNASGTAGMLELARVLAAHAAAQGFGSEDRRSLLFIAFGMEELGLIGSFFYCQSPRAPLSRLTAMLNLDMIGRLRERSLYVIGENTGREWAGMLRRYETSLTYVALADAGTDHRCFRQNGRPVLSLFTGLHEHYHQPTDDPPTLDAAGMKLVADLALDLAINLAVRPRPLTP